MSITTRASPRSASLKIAFSRRVANNPEGRRTRVFRHHPAGTPAPINTVALHGFLRVGPSHRNTISAVPTALAHDHSREGRVEAAPPPLQSLGWRGSCLMRPRTSPMGTHRNGPPLFPVRDATEIRSGNVPS